MGGGHAVTTGPGGHLWINPSGTTGGGGMVIGDPVTGATATRVLFVGAGPVLADSSALTFDSGTGTLSATILKATGLTSTRVPFATTGGQLTDAATLVFTSGSGTLTATALQATGLTSGRVPFAGASGLLGDDAFLTFSTTTGLLAEASDSAAAATLVAANLRHSTSTTATVGIATALVFSAENAAGTVVEAARVIGMLRGVTAGAEAGVVLLQAMSSGAEANLAHGSAGTWYGASGLGIGTLSATGVTTTLAQIAIVSSLVQHASSSASQGGHSFTGTVNTSGARQFFLITPSANTGSTASTEIKKFEYATYTQTWAAGALTTQREVVWNAPTYAFASASTITNAATVAITGAPIAGTNATLTNRYAVWVQADTTKLDGLLDLSGISAGSPNLKITATSDTPTTTFSAANATNAAPSGYLEIDVGGAARYIPFYA